MRSAPLALLLALAGGCLEPEPGPPASPPGVGAAVLLATGFTFQPKRLEVRPGITVVVQNLDLVPHDVTSAAAAGTLTPGAAPGAAPFETGPIPGSGLSAFAVPADAPVGATLPYFCRLHMLASEEGELVVVAP